MTTSDDEPTINFGNGTKYWYHNNNRHRVAGPAVIWDNGDMEWWLNGVLHREDGPAIDYRTRKEWYTAGVLHRCTGPAVEWINYGNQWWINGVNLSKEITQWFANTGFNSNYTTWTTQEQVEFKLRWS